MSGYCSGMGLIIRVILAPDGAADLVARTETLLFGGGIVPALLQSLGLYEVAVAELPSPYTNRQKHGSSDVCVMEASFI